MSTRFFVVWASLLGILLPAAWAGCSLDEGPFPGAIGSTGGGGGQPMSPCKADAECGGGRYCSSGACVAKLADGIACAPGGDASKCASGFCADGVCCNEKCDSTCKGCSKTLKGSGQDGVCEEFALGTDPRNGCSGLGACGRDGKCACKDGVQNNGEKGVDCGGACAGCSNGTKCSTWTDCASQSCVGGTCCVDTCGTCASCGNGDACQPLSPGRHDCDHGAVCDGVGWAKCKLLDGQTCGSSAECLSGVCSFPTKICQACSAVVACGLKLACRAGTCRGAVGATCSADLACATNHCVQGSCTECTPGTCGHDSSCVALADGTSGCLHRASEPCDVDSDCQTQHCSDPGDGLRVCSPP